MICDEKVKGKLKTEERSLFDTFIETSVKIWLTFGQIFYDIFETLCHHITFKLCDTAEPIFGFNWTFTINNWF